MTSCNIRYASKLACILCSAGLTMAGVPAFAQQSARQYDTLHHQQGTATVSWRDLDLTTSPGRAELQHRLQVTSRDLCAQLDPPDDIDISVGSCQFDARRKASEAVGTAIAQANARANGAAPGLQVARVPDSSTR